jgi:voltage-gated potassium channel
VPPQAANVIGMAATPAPLTAQQLRASERWQSRWNLPLILAALLPLFITSPDTRWVEVVVGLGTWIVFVIDLVVQRRIVPDYLHRRRGRVDLAIVVITCPYYLIPGISGGSAILLLARLGRVARVLLATAGLRRFAARLGKVALLAGAVVLVASLAAYQAEHAANPGFATVGDALWWGLVTLTTVGYGDIVPHTTAGRFAGVAIMFTGIGVLGVLAGSLAQLFHLDDQPRPATAAGKGTPVPVHAELEALRAELQSVERRLGDLVARARAADR